MLVLETFLCTNILLYITKIPVEQNAHVMAHWARIIAFVFSWVQKSMSSLQFFALSSHFPVSFGSSGATGSAAAGVVGASASPSPHKPHVSGHSSRYL